MFDPNPVVLTQNNIQNFFQTYETYLFSKYLSIDFTF